MWSGEKLWLEGKMDFSNRQESKRSLMLVTAVFKRPNHFATLHALGACAVLIGLLLPTPIAAQSRWSGVATIGYTFEVDDEPDKRSGPAALAGAFFRFSQAISLGLSFEYDYNGKETIFQPYGSIPGATMQIDPRKSMFTADLSFRIQKPSGNARPYATIGGGILILLTDTTWIARDASGSLIPGSSSQESLSEKRPLIVLGVGIVLPDVLGALGVGIHSRYRLAVGLEDGWSWNHYLTISVGISIN
jgi:hypothetical protein